MATDTAIKNGIEDEDGSNATRGEGKLKAGYTSKDTFVSGMNNYENDEYEGGEATEASSAAVKPSRGTEWKYSDITAHWPEIPLLFFKQRLRWTWP
jgi:hypothetical protein